MSRTVLDTLCYKNMFEIIENIRQKSDREKKRIAFLTSLLFSVIIFAIWISVWYPDWKNHETFSNRYAEPSSLAPLSSISSLFSSGFSEVQANFIEIKTMLGGK